jgi:hypothetical protein
MAGELVFRPQDTDPIDAQTGESAPNPEEAKKKPSQYDWQETKASTLNGHSGHYTWTSDGHGGWIHGGFEQDDGNYVEIKD